jgi:hypothetical protein
VEDGPTLPKQEIGGLLFGNLSVKSYSDEKSM